MAPSRIGGSWLRALQCGAHAAYQIARCIRHLRDECSHLFTRHRVDFQLESFRIGQQRRIFHAEIVLEGEILPDVLQREGPFGEWTGYYASAPKDDYVVRVRRVYHRHAPILTVGCPMRPPSDDSLSKCVMKAGMIWDQVERAGLSGVHGVWCNEAGVGRLFNIISIKQAYAGHAKQAGLLAAGAHAGNYMGRFVVVVDEDIDLTNTFDVLWAMGTRCDPVEDIEIIRKMWSGPLDSRKHRSQGYLAPISGKPEIGAVALRGPRSARPPQGDGQRSLPLV